MIALIIPYICLWGKYFFIICVFVQENNYKLVEELVYQWIVLSVAGLDNVAHGILDVFSSFISDETSDFNTNIYYSNLDYLRRCYEDGYLLD